MQHESQHNKVNVINSTKVEKPNDLLDSTGLISFWVNHPDEATLIKLGLVTPSIHVTSTNPNISSLNQKDLHHNHSKIKVKLLNDKILSPAYPPISTYNRYAVLSDELSNVGGMLEKSSSIIVNETNSPNHKCNDLDCKKCLDKQDEITVAVALKRNNLKLSGNGELLPAACFSYIRKNLSLRKARTNRIIRRIKRKWSDEDFRNNVKKRCLVVEPSNQPHEENYQIDENAAIHKRQENQLFEQKPNKNTCSTLVINKPTEHNASQSLNENELQLSDSCSKLNEKVNVVNNCDDCDAKSTQKSTEHSSRLEVKTKPLFCVCQKPNDGSLYIECSTCKEWFHPQCIFQEHELGFSLTDDEWAKYSFACMTNKIYRANLKRSKPTLYHKNQVFALQSKDNTLQNFAENTENKCNQTLNNQARNSQSNYVKIALKNHQNIVQLDNQTNVSALPKPLMPMPEHKSFSPKNCSPLHELSNTNNATPNNVPNTQYNLDKQLLKNEKLRNNVSADAYENNSTTTTIYQTCDADMKDPALSYETLEKLGDFKESIQEKELARFSEVYVNERVIPISLEEWQQMTKDRSKKNFTGSTYVDILIPKLRAIYSGCAFCIDYNYLKKPSNVLTLRNTDGKYLEGYVKVYCIHSTCCKCDVYGRVDFYAYHDRIEAILNISGNRSHFKTCRKSRPVKGKQRKELLARLENEKPNALHEKLQLKLSEEERVYGSFTFAPSHAVLRNIKYEGNVSQRYSDDWVTNVRAMEKSFLEKSGSFIKDVRISLNFGPEIILFSDAQLKVYGQVCRRDIVYFDATGSVLKKFECHKDFQIYTLLVRHPNEGGPALPVATNVTARHDAVSICSFLDFFLKAATKMLGSKSKPIMIMIDGSMAMWNAVLRAFSNETRAQYYMRCWRIVTGKARSQDLKKTLVHNCLSHAMRAAKCLVTKYYHKRFKNEVMFWIALLFSCSTLDEIDNVIRSLIVVLNCEKTSKIVRQHFQNLQ